MKMSTPILARGAGSRFLIALVVVAVVWLLALWALA